MKGGTCNSPRYGPTINTNSTLLGSGTLLNISSICSSDVFPATLTSGLGLLQVWGRIRVAQPAMGIKIFSVSLIIQFYRVSYVAARHFDCAALRANIVPLRMPQNRMWFVWFFELFYFI